jgi:hypothetical protein
VARSFGGLALDDEEYTFFIFTYDLKDSKKTNAGDLSNLYAEGWCPDMQSDEVVHQGVVTIFMHLVRKKYKAGERSD